MLRRAPSSVGAGYHWWAGGGEAGACCTESLGSESGDVGFDATEIDQFFPPVPASGGPDPDATDADADVAALGGAEEEEEEARAAPEKRRRFPPVMPRATGALVLRAERRGGRLILTEVRADEHERRVVFRAQRDGGRLRLRFANDDDAYADPERGGGGSEEGGGSGSAGTGPGGVVPVAVQVQHGGGGGGGGGGELCQVAAGRRGGVEVGAVVMGTI